MKVWVVTRVRIGFSIAIFTTLVITEMIATSAIDIRQRKGAVACLALCLAGFLIWATPQRRKVNLAQTCADPAAPTGPPPLNDPLAPFRSRRFWGILLMVSALVLAGASAYRYAAPKPVAAKPIACTPAPSVVFPPLKLQGVIINGAKSSALINDQVLMIGEDVEGVRLVSVDTEHATVEKGGQTKVLSLPE